jgi:hypothetical protein
VPESRDFANAAAESSTAYAHYLLRASIQSARTLHLAEQVLGCVARRQLAPEALRETLTRLLRNRGAESTAKAAGLIARFFGGLAASAAHLPVDAAPPPVFDPADPIGWFRKLGAYAVERNTRAVQDYQSLIARLAAGEMKPNELRQTMSEFYNRGIAEQLGQVARLWFELLGGLEDLSAHFAEEYLQAVLANAQPVGFDSDVLDLAAPLGQITSTVIYIENTREERSAVRCAVGEVRRADGVGSAFLPDVTVAPAELLLDRDGEAAVRLSLRLDETVYEADVSYIGALHILRDGESRLDVPLRITASEKEPG